MSSQCRNVHQVFIYFSDVCDEPKRVGPCRAAKPRFYFNTATGQCQRFSWGGCQPNGNNFLTESQCNAACSGQAVSDVCDRPKRVGPCRARIPRYYYNRASGECDRFYWGGCMSNGNNFRSYYGCTIACNVNYYWERY